LKLNVNVFGETHMIESARSYIGSRLGDTFLTIAMMALIVFFATAALTGQSVPIS